MKIGVFICHCGFNIAEIIDIEALMNRIRKDEELILIEDDYVCSEQGLNKLKEKIVEENIDRVVIASCSPKVHEHLFRETLKEAGINQFLLEIANIREQCSWVHRNEPNRATVKASDLINAAIEKVKKSKPYELMKVPVKKSALVIGGGIAGIKSALSLSDMGIDTYIVEREPSIGGHMAMLDKTFPSLDCSICILAPLMLEVDQRKNITLLTYSEVVKVSGHIGDYKVEIERKPRFVDESKCIGCIETCSEVCPIEIGDKFNNYYNNRKAIYLQFPQAIPMVAVIDPNSCIGCRACETFCDREAINFDQKSEIVKLNVGAVIIASGYDVFNAAIYQEYGYGRYKNVITAMDMERFLSPSGPTDGFVLRPSDGEPAEKIAFLQCVGSRDEKVGRPGCSRVCCMYAIKQAVEIKERNPNAEVHIFYIDIRAFGKGYEEFYVNAQTNYNINFIRGRISEVYEERESKNLILRSEDTLLNRLMEIEVDLLVLSVGLIPDKDLKHLARIFRIDRSEDGFLLESHPKLRASESTLKGIYLAGCVQGPKDIQDSISHAESAAMKVASLLKLDEVELDTIVPEIDQDTCLKCRLCERVCEYKALEYNKEKGVMELDNLSCSGCGVCVASCPTGAIYIPNCTNNQIISEIDAILEEKKDYPLIIGFFCNWCSYTAADFAGIKKIQYPTNIRIIKVVCAGRVSPMFVLRALSRGADGVLIGGCYEQDCHYRIGFKQAKQRTEALKELLEDAGIDSRRVRIISANAQEGYKIANEVSDFIEFLEEIGPIGTEFASENNN